MKTEVISAKAQRETVLEKYDYTVHSNIIQTSSLPTVKFHYELSPMQVWFTFLVLIFSRMLGAYTVMHSCLGKVALHSLKCWFKIPQN